MASNATGQQTGYSNLRRQGAGPHQSICSSAKFAVCVSRSDSQHTIRIKPNSIRAGVSWTLSVQLRCQALFETSQFREESDVDFDRRETLRTTGPGTHFKLALTSHTFEIPSSILLKLPFSTKMVVDQGSFSRFPPPYFEISFLHKNGCAVFRDSFSHLRFLP